MGMGYCEAGNTESQNDKFLIPDFNKIVEDEKRVLAARQIKELKVMAQEARDKIREEKFYSLKSVSVVLGCTRSTLRKWLNRHKVEVIKRVTVDSNHQRTLALTKKQVQFVMNKKMI